MKKSILFAVAILGLFGHCTARAYDGNKVRFFTALEYWTPANAYKNTEDAYIQEHVYSDMGILLSKKSGGSGLRAGAFFMTPVKGLEIGGSLGYIQGPNAKLSDYTEDFAPGAATWTAKDDYKASYVRFLAQIQKRFSISDKFDFRMGAGAGVAFGKLERDLVLTATGAGSWMGAPGWTSANSFSGFTYEVGPSVVFKATRVNVELGVVYAAFPKMKETQRNGEVDSLFLKWNPIGIRLGVEF